MVRFVNFVAKLDFFFPSIGRLLRPKKICVARVDLSYLFVYGFNFDISSKNRNRNDNLTSLVRCNGKFSGLGLRARLSTSAPNLPLHVFC